jgi:hypothetical protein
MQFDFTRAKGLRYIIQTSTNLTQWQNVLTNIGVGRPECLHRFG